MPEASMRSELLARQAGVYCQQREAESDVPSIQTEMRDCRHWLLLCTTVVLSLPASAQVREQRLVGMALDCAMHEEAGPWVPADLHRDGLLRFNFVDTPPHSTHGPYEYDDDLHRLYAAFWNASRTRAEFLDFSIDKSGTKDWLTISNEGQISISKGKLDFEFFQGGEWTREHYLIRIRRLRTAPVQVVAVREIKRTGVLSDSLASPHPEWDPNWKPPKPRK